MEKTDADLVSKKPYLSKVSWRLATAAKRQPHVPLWNATHVIPAMFFI